MSQKSVKKSFQRMTIIHVNDYIIDRQVCSSLNVNIKDWLIIDLGISNLGIWNG
jgi:hypothetical protein